MVAAHTPRRRGTTIKTTTLILIHASVLTCFLFIEFAKRERERERENENVMGKYSVPPSFELPQQIV